VHLEGPRALATGGKGTHAQILRRDGHGYPEVRQAISTFFGQRRSVPLHEWQQWYAQYSATGLVPGAGDMLPQWEDDWGQADPWTPLA